VTITKSGVACLTITKEKILRKLKRLGRKGMVLVLLFIGLDTFGQNINQQKLLYLVNGTQKMEVNPELFSITAVDEDGMRYPVSAPLQKEALSGLVFAEKGASWNYPEKGIQVSLELHPDFLEVSIKASKTTEFTWPVLNGKMDALTIPLHQGKYIPARDTVWISHLTKSGPLSGSQDLSMQFFAVNTGDKALVYVIRNMFNNELNFANNNGALGLSFNHEFPATVSNKQYGFRIYQTANSTTAIAKTYKKYVEEKGKIITLEQKAADNPNIRKLYGAPHIYIWNDKFLVSDDLLNWKLFKKMILEQLKDRAMNPTKSIFRQFSGGESGREFQNQLNDFVKEDFITKYQKNGLVQALNEVLLRKDFYNKLAWSNVKPGKEALNLIGKGLDQLNAVELYRLNKLLLGTAYPGVFRPIADWGGALPKMLDEMQAGGVKTAWLGLNDWMPAEIHPEFVSKAVANGYLIGPYDSYHSIHQPGKEGWITAKLTDTTLFTKAFVMKKNGKPSLGFLGKGRKLNPTLSMPAVKNRMADVMQNTGKVFNSWFIDCDATGESLDDYTPGRMTSQEDDINARLQRMAWIRDTYKLVVGSEVGNVFAADVIAYGHGMTTPVIAWNDPDMRKNKTSKYYIGGYFSNNGGVPDRYGLQAALKEEYRYLYYDNRFNIPLFQLVYNNAVITSHHWEWGSLKVPSEIKNTELKEILFNVPPLYHLNEDSWLKFKEIISKHVKVFSKTHEVAAKLEMTAFDWLSKDQQVQKTTFGDQMEVVANFGKTPFTYKNQVILPQTLIIHDLIGHTFEVYKP
jgi:hypothetical protein